jgi:peptidoglycan/LPS O-acetylase OafA/YrhL
VACLGTLSYSFYLWQQPFLNRGAHAWWTSFPQNLTLALFFAAASYYWVEQPFLAMRERRKQKTTDQALIGKKPAARHEERGTVIRVA